MILNVGEETGSYYAIDLGGTNFRLMYCKFGSRSGEVQQEEKTEVPIPQDRKRGSAQQLFDYIGTSLKDFVLKTSGSLDSVVCNLLIEYLLLSLLQRGIRF